MFNTASGFFGAVNGGYRNDASGDAATVSGGKHNDAIGNCSTVSGGADVSTSSHNAHVPDTIW